MVRPLLTWFKSRIVTREVLVVVLWGIGIAALLTHDLFHGSFPSLVDDGIFLVFGLMAGAIIAEFRRALLGFIFALIIGTTLTFVLTTLPAITGVVAPPADQAVYGIWTIILFRAIFPFPFVISLMSSIIGVGVGETYLEDMES